MVHTFDIGMNVFRRDEVIELMQLFQFSRRSLELFDIKGYAIKKMGAIRKGIKYFCVTKCMGKVAGQSQAQCLCYSFTIRMEPWSFIIENETTDLFDCSADNIEILTDLFGDFMLQYVQGTDYVHWAEMINWNCRRIDYTHNFRFDDKRDAETFLILSKRTSLHRRTKEKRRRDRYKFDQSTAEANLSNKSIFYDKQAQIEDDYAGMDEDDLDELTRSASNVIRYEIQCFKGKVSTIKRKYNLESRSIIEFLNEDIANELLIKQYESSIGYGDFYVLHRAKSRIMHYEGRLSRGQKITPSKRIKLFQFMQMVAQVCGLDKARKCFHDGVEIKNTKDHIVVHGSDNTFLERLRDLAVLGINPVPIPRSSKKKNAEGEIIKEYDYPKYIENPIHSW